ncbi:MAG: phospholipase D-like domain-containing protein [Endomicrobia bacterium]|nr:phospholipase D-like domain-containing protein [Endomicrobiia bacterium]
MSFLYEFIKTYIPQISVVITIFYIYIVISAVCAIHILLNKEDVKGSISWLGIVILSPFVGAVLYVFLGINRVRRKAVKLRKKGSIPQKIPKDKLEAAAGYMPRQFIQYMLYGHNVYPQIFVAGNFVRPLQNGTSAYPEMVEAIKNAKHEVLIESYMFDYDSETEKILDACKTAVSNGAAVKILVDGIGIIGPKSSAIEPKLKKINKLEYGVFLPPNLPVALPLVNMRNHRKIMIIDGVTAFFGGMNLALENTLTDIPDKGVQDITFKIEGPVVDQMSQVFEDDWEFTTGKPMHGYSKDLPASAKGDIPARIIPDGPDNKQGKIELIVQAAINTAAEKISIVTPYFLPESNLLTSLEMAAMRGVDVEIVIPSKTDSIIMDWAMEPNFTKLIERGVKIYKTPRPFDHSKYFVVDNMWVFIGSANWDVRSFRLHFECNMELFSKEVAEELAKITEQKKKNAELAAIEQSKSLPFLKRIRNNACRLLTPYY